MSACAQHFIDPNRAPRICDLEQGHEGGCAGRLDPAVRKHAKRSARAAHARMEAEQRLAVQQAPRAAGADLSPAQLAAAVREAALQLGGSADYSEVLAWIEQRQGSPLRCAGLLVARREIRQVAHRLERDGLLMIHGSSLIAL